METRQFYSRVVFTKYFLMRENFSFFHTLTHCTVKYYNFALTKIFREINVLSTFFSKTIGFTNFLSKWEREFSKFSQCHSVEIRIFLSHSIFSQNWKKFRENNVLRALYSKNGFRNGPISHIWRKFAQVWPIWCYRGRFGLTKSIETSVIRGTLEKLLASKLCQIQS